MRLPSDVNADAYQRQSHRRAHHFAAMKASIENALDGECWKGQGEQLDQACHNLRILAFEQAVFE